jgi:ABC-type multidrug transport system ATPase subunit
VNEPEVLVLDEPAVGLDPPSVSDLVSMIGSMKTRTGTSVVIASHDMDPFLEILDFMMLLQEGHIAAFGTPDEVCSELADDETFRPWLPDLAVLVHDLRAAGYPIRPNVFRIPDLAQQLTDIVQSRGGNS